MKYFNWEKWFILTKKFYSIGLTFFFEELFENDFVKY